MPIFLAKSRLETLGFALIIRFTLPSVFLFSGPGFLPAPLPWSNVNRSWNRFNTLETVECSTFFPTAGATGQEIPGVWKEFVLSTRVSSLPFSLNRKTRLRVWQHVNNTHQWESVQNLVDFYPMVKKKVMPCWMCRNNFVFALYPIVTVSRPPGSSFRLCWLGIQANVMQPNILSFSTDSICSLSFSLGSHRFAKTDLIWLKADSSHQAAPHHRVHSLLAQGIA